MSPSLMSSGAVVAPTPERLVRADADERVRLLERYVRAELGRVLGIAPDLVDTTGRAMGCLGIGSISAIELQLRMRAALGVDVHLRHLLTDRSAQALIDFLVEEFTPDGVGGRA
ncbi:acyl carrier protein [Streptomyces sp. RerS4]|uniref:acyl carrier protein n=1 Tax=Streptomyces sp. RerS4 TaxID=2942449 RepID=UPI00201BB390|nr:acyl carrier protein [Streptomyces sp. RerS4]UQX05472.1 acyl carrier protein [Streptomyces sp. RerS4]